MKPLFGTAGRAAMRDLLHRRPLFAFDFDGTLAPIVSRPEDARVAAAVAVPLARLAAQAPVAVITGRAVHDVRRRLGFEPAFLVGNHGAEDAQHSGDAADRAALEALRLRLGDRAAALTASGVTVEDKGLSIALHYRLARDRRTALAAIDQALHALDPRLRRFGGKCVANVVPAAAPDKADALFALVARSGSGSALFVGDDVNDEPVFERAPAHWLTVRVGLDAGHSSARFFVDGPASLAPLLQRLLVLLRDLPAGRRG